MLRCSVVRERVLVAMLALVMAERWFVQMNCISCMSFGGF